MQSFKEFLELAEEAETLAEQKMVPPDARLQKWIVDNKQGFIDRFGEERGTEIATAKAWVEYNRMKFRRGSDDDHISLSEMVTDADYGNSCKHLTDVISTHHEGPAHHAPAHVISKSYKELKGKIGTIKALQQLQSLNIVRNRHGKEPVFEAADALHLQLINKNNSHKSLTVAINGDKYTYHFDPDTFDNVHKKFMGLSSKAPGAALQLIKNKSTGYKKHD